MFNKYKDSGSYHWKKISNNIFHYSPRLSARYDLAISFAVGKSNPKTLKGLDIGCGDGVVLYKLTTLGADVCGIDADEEGVRLANDKLASKGLDSSKVKVGNCYDLNYESNSFDFVTSVEVIEHLENVSQYLTEIYRVLKPSGVFVCTTPQRDPSKADDFVRDPYHVKEYTAQELNDEIATIFNDTKVYGAFPKNLDNKYLKYSSISILNSLHKVWFKFKSKYFSNPYMRSVEQNPSRDYDQLIAVAKKI